METSVLMQRWSLTMQQGMITKWVKNEGERVNAGEIICYVEAEKVNIEVKSPVSGILIKIYTPEGATVPVEEVIAIISSEG